MYHQQITKENIEKITGVRYGTPGGVYIDDQLIDVATYLNVKSQEEEKLREKERELELIKGISDIINNSPSNANDKTTTHETHEPHEPNKSHETQNIVVQTKPIEIIDDKKSTKKRTLVPKKGDKRRKRQYKAKPKTSKPMEAYEYVLDFLNKQQIVLENFQQSEIYNNMEFNYIDFQNMRQYLKCDKFSFKYDKGMEMTLSGVGHKTVAFIYRYIRENYDINSKVNDYHRRISILSKKIVLALIIKLLMFPDNHIISKKSSWVNQYIDTWLYWCHLDQKISIKELRDYVNLIK